MRVLALAVPLVAALSACAHPTPAAAPAPAAPAPAPAPALVPEPAAPAYAPRLFDAAALRDGFVLGTKIRLRMETTGEPPTEQRWQVTAHTAEGCTIASQVYDIGTGELVADEGEGTSSWAELEGHATFPADRTEIADDQTITVPAGTFAARRYTVREDDGTVKVLYFARDLPGPPVSMVVSRGDDVLMSMVLLERTAP